MVLAWAAIETSKRECMCFILGYGPTKKNNILCVTEVIPLQSVKHRLNTGVEQSDRSEKRLNAFLPVFRAAGPRHLGFFHSHPDWGESKPIIGMSKTDIDSVDAAKTDLEIIVTIFSRKKGRAVWEILPDGSIKGSWNGFNFRFDAYAIVSEGDEKKPQRLSIAKPSAATLNKIFAI